MEIKKITGKDQFTIIPLKEDKEPNKGSNKESDQVKKSEKLDSKNDDSLFEFSLILFVFVLLALFIMS